MFIELTLETVKNYLLKQITSNIPNTITHKIKYFGKIIETFAFQMNNYLQIRFDYLYYLSILASKRCWIHSELAHIKNHTNISGSRFIGFTK